MDGGEKESEVQDIKRDGSEREMLRFSSMLHTWAEDRVTSYGCGVEVMSSLSGPRVCHQVERKEVPP